MQNIPSATVDLILCDLPYGTTRARWDVPIDLSKLWLEYSRISRGAIVLFAQSPFDKVLGASNLPMLRYEWIWEKSNATGFLNAKRAPMKAHENILVFAAGLPPYYPIKTHGHPRKSSVRRKNLTPIYGAQKVSTYDSTERYPRSVLKFSSDKQRERFHPQQKPINLLSYLIQTHSKPHDLVLDNCMGSGSTGVACMLTGRRFLGIDNDVEWFNRAKCRLEERLIVLRDES